jgi:hypothetical protein
MGPPAPELPCSHTPPASATPTTSRWSDPCATTAAPRETVVLERDWDAFLADAIIASPAPSSSHARSPLVHEPGPGSHPIGAHGTAPLVEHVRHPFLSQRGVLSRRFFVALDG